MEKMRKVYDRVFKEKAVQLSYKRHNISELARELGVTAPQLYKAEKSMKSLDKEVYQVTALSSKRQSRSELLNLKENSKMQK
jgi:transposase-like protein